MVNRLPHSSGAKVVSTNAQRGLPDASADTVESERFAVLHATN